MKVLGLVFLTALTSFAQAYADCPDLTGYYQPVLSRDINGKITCEQTAELPLPISSGQPLSGLSAQFYDASSGPGKEIPENIGFIQKGCNDLSLLQGFGPGNFLNTDALDMSHASFSGDVLTIRQSAHSSADQSLLNGTTEDQILNWTLARLDNGDIQLGSIYKETHVNWYLHILPEVRSRTLSGSCILHKIAELPPQP